MFGAQYAAIEFVASCNMNARIQYGALMESSAPSAFLLVHDD